MAAKITYDEYVEYLCQRGKVKREQLFAQLKADGRHIIACDCDDYDNCQGWQCRWSMVDEEVEALPLT